MKYGDLHLKDNEKLHSCFPCLGIGSGAFREETTAGFKYCQYKSVLNRCPGLCLASFCALVLHLPFLLTCYGLGHVRKVQVKAESMYSQRACRPQLLTFCITLDRGVKLVFARGHISLTVAVRVECRAPCPQLRSSYIYTVLKLHSVL